MLKHAGYYCYCCLCVLQELNCRVVRVERHSKNLCGLVCLCRGVKGTATNLIWPSDFNFTPSHHQPPDIILLLFKLSRNPSCFSATTSSICPSPLPLHPTPLSLSLPAQTFITPLLKLHWQLCDVKMHQPKWPKSWAATEMRQMIDVPYLAIVCLN